MRAGPRARIPVAPAALLLTAPPMSSEGATQPEARGSFDAQTRSLVTDRGGALGLTPEDEDEVDKAGW